MKAVDWKSLDLKPQNIIICETSYPDEEMTRRFLIKEQDSKEYVILEGYHCSCYDFYDTEWQAVSYEKNELMIIAKAEYNKFDGFWIKVLDQIKH